MPDVNLLEDTEKPQDSARKVPPPPPDHVELSSPEAQKPKGLGGVFRSLFNRKQQVEIEPAPTSTMGGLGKKRTGERILSEKKSSATGVIPLPEDESYNVNLLTEDLVGRFSARQKLIQLGFAAIGAVAVVGLVFGALTYYEGSVTSQVAQARADLAQTKSQIGKLQDKQQQITDTTKKISAIKALIDRHVRWTKFFAQLEKYTLPSVTYGTVFNGDIQGNLTFSARTDTYEHVAEQYLVLQQAVANHDFISSFEISGANRSTTTSVPTVSFTIALTLEPSLLENAAEPPASTTPTQP